MRWFIDKTVKPVLIIGGLGTAAAGLYAFFPQFAVENIAELEFVGSYTIFVQHWGMMVGLFGVMMVAAAFQESWRTPILLYGLIEKAFMVFLVVANLEQPFASKVSTTHQDQATLKYRRNYRDTVCRNQN